MNALKKRFYFCLSYFFTWVLYFVIARFFFLIYYLEKTTELDWKTILQIPIQGLKLDLSFSAYLCIIPFLIITFSVWIPQNITKTLIKISTFPFVFFVSLLLLFDLALYGPWGIRIDATPLIYINTPKEMLASVPTTQIIWVTLLWMAISFGYSILFNKLINRSTPNFHNKRFWHFPILLFVTASLVIIMRGGLQTIPINHSSVYFSENLFANHAAINFGWNFSHSVNSNTYQNENPFRKMDLLEAKKISEKKRKPMTTVINDSIRKSILNHPKPNVILIIWESLTAKLVASLDGVPNVTENFDKLTEEGLLFTNFYANGDRSDKGLVAILSGYYPQAHKSIIKIPNKSRTLPSLNKEMKAIGYTNSFYHGGDLGFGNMKSYLRFGDVHTFVDGGDFASEDHNSKWGAHDHVLFKRFLNDLKTEKSSPFFKTIFTLSSHEPFEFPGVYKFGKNNPTNMFKSVHAYTDKTIGKFITEAKKEPWWDNTLVIILADHGHSLPKHKGIFNGPKKFHIPMLWLGGALAKKNSTINNICSQSDLAYNLLDLLDGDNSKFTWSKNIFSKSEKHYAHYIFNRGFGNIDKNGVVVFDYTSNQTILSEGIEKKNREKAGKAITQSAYQDFLNRK